MTKAIPLSAEFQDLSSLQRFALRFDRADQNRFLDRMARLDAKRDDRAPASALRSDAALTQDGQALEQAWRVEVQAFIVMKRRATPEAAAALRAARGTTATIVRRIEAAPAATAEGLRVKARAASWRRHGEPASAGRW